MIRHNPFYVHQISVMLIHAILDGVETQVSVLQPNVAIEETLLYAVFMLHMEMEAKLKVV